MTKGTSPLASILRHIEAYGFWNFVASAKVQLKSMEPKTAEHAILTYLLENAVGTKNAKSWKVLNAHLRKLGFRMTKNTFQNGLLARSRRNPYYIGSCHKGFFLIETQSDVNVMGAFYAQRMAGEQANWQALDYLASKAHFTPPDDPDAGALNKAA